MNIKPLFLSVVFGVFMLLGNILVTDSVSGMAFAAEKASAEKSNAKPLVIGIFPRRNPSTTLKLFTPLAKYLEQKLGREVAIRTAKNFKDFWGHLQKGEYDVVHFNQYHYVKSHKELGYKVILQNEEFGSQKLSGAIYVRSDSNINSLADLKGKKIGFGGGKLAMISYIAPSALLKKAGLTAGTDYFEQFAKNPPVSVLSTFHKKFDAGGAGDVVIKLGVVTNKIDTKQMKILAKTDPLAHIPWAVKGDMSDELSQQIQKSMLELNNSESGKAILKKAKLTGIHAANDDDYNPHREMIKFVTGQSY